MVGGFDVASMRACALDCARSRSFTSGGLGEGIHANLCASHLPGQGVHTGLCGDGRATSSTVVSFCVFCLFSRCSCSSHQCFAPERFDHNITTPPQIQSLPIFAHCCFFFQLFFFCWRVALFQKRSQRTCTCAACFCLHLQSGLALVIKMSHLESSPHLSFSSLQLWDERSASQ